MILIHTSDTCQRELRKNSTAPKSGIIQYFDSPTQFSTYIFQHSDPISLYIYMLKLWGRELICWSIFTLNKSKMSRTKQSYEFIYSIPINLISFWGQSNGINNSVITFYIYLKYILIINWKLI